MQDPQIPARQDYLARSDVELELARIALAVMRAAPDAFEGLGAQARPPHARPGELAAGLLARTRPEHRPFVEARLRELARCHAGGHAAATHEWLDVAVGAVRGMPASQPGATPASHANDAV